jgi:type II secretory pathway component PulF
MPIYIYKGMDAGGALFKKEIWADSLEGATDALIKEEIWFTEVFLKKSTAKSGLKLEDKILFFQDLYQLLHAGIVLFDAMDLIQQKFEGTKNYPLFLGIKESLKRGKSFSQAMEETNLAFDPVTVGMIRMAETSGQIVSTIKEILHMLKKKQALKKQVISAVSYPAFLMVLALLIMVVLLCFLVPSLKELFSEKNLPFLTRLILHASTILTDNGGVLGFFFVVSPFVIRSFLKLEKISFFLGEALLKMPLVSGFLKELMMARFCRTLFALVAANVPLVEALELCKGVMENRFFIQTIDRALFLIHQGNPISVSFKECPLISPLFCRMLETAEKSGELKTVLEQAGELYEQSVETSLKKMVGVLQPFLIIFIGLIVGLIMIGTLLPMTDIRSFMEAS